MHFVDVVDLFDVHQIQDPKALCVCVTAVCGGFKMLKNNKPLEFWRMYLVDFVDCRVPGGSAVAQ